MHFTKIKTHADACKALGKPVPAIKIEGVSEKRAEVLTILNELIDCSDAYRDGWVPDYNNRNQYKYEAWVWLNQTPKDPSGFRFDYSYLSLANSNSVVGPLFCQETSEKAEGFFKTFADRIRVVMKYLSSQDK